jgi:hypothetical protein
VPVVIWDRHTGAAWKRTRLMGCASRPYDSGRADDRVAEATPIRDKQELRCRMSEHEAPEQRPTKAARPLRILVENSEYWLRNNGDLAMLPVTLDQMHQRWPDARIAVLTDSPCLLRPYFPRAKGISVFDEEPWVPPTRLERLAGHLGSRVVGPIVLARLRLPDRLRTGRRKLLRLARRRPAPADVPASETAPLPTGPFYLGSAAAAAQSSLVRALGGGYLTDADRT